MTFEPGDTVRVTKGDMRGRIGTIRTTPSDAAGGTATYSVAFPDETRLTNFRGGNIEHASEAEAVPEYLQLGPRLHLLTGEEPYKVLTGGWDGARRRYSWVWEPAPPEFAPVDGTRDEYDFRRFPVERDGVVVAGLWCREEPTKEDRELLLAALSAR